VGECDEVTTAVSGQFRGDESGYWEGNLNFRASNALYELDLSNIEISPSDYKRIMSDLRENMIPLSKIAIEQDLLQNLLYWMTWEYTLPYVKSLNRFRMTGSPAAVFDRYRARLYLTLNYLQEYVFLLNQNIHLRRDFKLSWAL
jgi:hypothetical protein